MHETTGEKPAWMKKGPAPQRPTSPRYRQSKSDAIREMESFGRKSGDDEAVEDNPPFNFQAMLRKTKHNRNSMKRTGGSNLSLAQDSDYANNNSGKLVNYDASMFD
jgi:hypothetical protein